MWLISVKSLLGPLQESCLSVPSISHQSKLSLRKTKHIWVCDRRGCGFNSEKVGWSTVQMYLIPTKAFLPPHLMSSPAVLAPCLLRFTCLGVGRASLTAWLLFLQRYARGAAGFSQECVEASHSSHGLNVNHWVGGQVLRCMRLCWQCGHCLCFSLLTLKTYKSQPAMMSSPDPFCCEQAIVILQSIMPAWSMLKLLTATNAKRLELEALKYVFGSLCYQFMCFEVIRLINCMTSGWNFKKNWKICSFICSGCKLSQNWSFVIFCACIYRTVKSYKYRIVNHQYTLLIVGFHRKLAGTRLSWIDGNLVLF